MANMITGESLPTQHELSGTPTLNFHHACDVGLGWASLRTFSPLLWSGYRKFDEACAAVQAYTLPPALKAWQKVRSSSRDASKLIRGQDILFAEATAEVVNSPNELAKEILAVLIAGTDSTGSVLSFAILLLARYPALAKELRKQVLEAFGHDAQGLADLSALSKFEPLQNLIHEVLRLYPPIPLSFRVAKQTCVLPRGAGTSGTEPFVLKKGETLAFSTYVLHRREDIWGKDANEFRPDRWRNQSIQFGGR
ncbi:hypothetical protein HIM_12201 [Hirsutella minnesotensis 3608]|uniref:Cytochrome P450 n=1 Tax=Hirsutella minnesotensis 3608 TaxID=1043627 RepID=A0A0F7ZQT1_9HYPO|nr:hypothetical protein HIM_12201 [Hirsutella minnesotensis 3608]